MRRVRKAVFLGIGILAGLALSGPAAQAAEAVLAARPTTQTFYLDGVKIDLTAYLIGGSNYVRLRDIGRAVDFGVTYDAADNTVHIDPDAPYIEEVTTPAPATPSPQAVTEESVQAALSTLRERYPNNTPWPAPYRSTSGGPYHSGMNCAGWATLCSDAAFGSLPWRRVDNPSWDEIRSGDLVEYDSGPSGHVIVVINKTADAITFTDSGTTQRAYWGGQYTREWLEQQPDLTLYTRYPN